MAEKKRKATKKANDNKVNTDSTKINTRIYRKKIKYKKYTFKLSKEQKDLLMEYCKKHKKTPIKLFKTIIMEHIHKYVNKKTPAEQIETLSSNQLSLF